MREVVTCRTRTEAAVVIIVAAAGAVLMAVLALILLPFGLYRQMSLNHLSRPMVRPQRSNTEGRSRTEIVTNTVMHHKV